jgi:hypothetical protein
MAGSSTIGGHGGAISPPDRAQAPSTAAFAESTTKRHSLRRPTRDMGPTNSRSATIYRAQGPSGVEKVLENRPGKTARRVIGGSAAGGGAAAALGHHKREQTGPLPTAARQGEYPVKHPGPGPKFRAYSATCGQSQLRGRATRGQTQRVEGVVAVGHPFLVSGSQVANRTHKFTSH